MTPAPLRVDVPRLEPSDAFVAQLAGLAGVGAAVAAPAPATTPWWSRPVAQVAFAIASVLLVVGSALALGQVRGSDQQPTHKPDATPAPTATSTGIPSPSPRTDVRGGTPGPHDRASSGASGLPRHGSGEPTPTAGPPASVPSGPRTVHPADDGSDGAAGEDEAPSTAASDEPTDTDEPEDDPTAGAATDDGGDDAG